MSKFPTIENFTLKSSQQQLSKLSTKSPFVLKKAKEVYLYDIDGNKYVDFSLNNGTILQHSPPRLTKFIKNALSSGLNAMGLIPKFLYKAQILWKKNLSVSEVSFFKSPTMMLLSVVKYYSVKKIAYTSDYLYSLLNFLEPWVVLSKVDDISDFSDVDLILFEEYNDKQQKVTYPKDIKIPSIKIHSRFLYRRNNTSDFSEDCLHFVSSIVFGGKEIGVLGGSDRFNYETPAFDEGILFLEGGKIFSQQKSCPHFKHNVLSSYNGYAISKKDLDQGFFLQRGIYITDNTIYISPNHSALDLKRLTKALNDYFPQG